MWPHDVHTSSAPRAPAPRPAGDPAAMRRTATHSRSALARLALAPFAALAGALAGMVFVVLLPICGIASIAEAIAKACARFLRDAWQRGATRGALPRA